MSWKMKCPNCGTTIYRNLTGRICHFICDCHEENAFYCDTVHDTVCCQGSSGCSWCSSRDDEDEDGCDVDDGWENRLCDCSDDCDSYERPVNDDDYCERGHLCCRFYFHPVLHKAIYCPSCGSYDVDLANGIWHLKCNSCNTTFDIGNTSKEINNQKNIDRKLKKINEEKEKINLLKEYRDLLDEGTISVEDFENKKNEILNIFK